MGVGNREVKGNIVHPPVHFTNARNSQGSLLMPVVTNSIYASHVGQGRHSSTWGIIFCLSGALAGNQITRGERTQSQALSWVQQASQMLAQPVCYTTTPIQENYILWLQSVLSYKYIKMYLASFLQSNIQVFPNNMLYTFRYYNTLYKSAPHKCLFMCMFGIVIKKRLRGVPERHLFSRHTPGIKSCDSRTNDVTLGELLNFSVFP